MIWQDFFNMGGYAFHVWTSWGLTLLVLLWNVMQPKLSKKKRIAQLKRQQQRQKKLN